MSLQHMLQHPRLARERRCLFCILCTACTQDLHPVCSALIAVYVQQASQRSTNGTSPDPGDPQWAGEGAYGGDDEEEGPAARAVRELELQLAAAEQDALRSVDYSTDSEVGTWPAPKCNATTR